MQLKRSCPFQHLYLKVSHLWQGYVHWERFWHVKNPSYLEAENIQGKKDGNLGGNFSHVEAIHKGVVEVLERHNLSESLLSCLLI